MKQGGGEEERDPTPSAALTRLRLLLLLLLRLSAVPEPNPAPTKLGQLRLSAPTNKKIGYEAALKVAAPDPQHWFSYAVITI